MGRNCDAFDLFTDIEISIYAPRMGRNFNASAQTLFHSVFQYTRPVWGATGGDAIDYVPKGISIYAPRMGRNQLVELLLCHLSHFNIRAPYGAQQGRDTGHRHHAGISIYAPRMGRNR